MKHNTLIIEGLIVAVLVVVVFLAFRSFFGDSKGETGEVSAPSGDLEVAIKKILEQANKVSPTATTGGTPESNEQVQKLSSEIGVLKTELETKQKQIEEMKSAPAGAATGNSGLSDEEKAKLETQLKELQAKLQEYEIISEDIADLSLYKEQNAKLAQELEALKKGGATAAPAAAADPAPTAIAQKPEPVIVPAPPPPVAEVAPPAPETASVVAETAPAETAVAEPTPEEPSSEVLNVVDDALMSEFTEAVEKQGGTVPPPSASEAAVAATGEADAGINLGTMDFDKMMQETKEMPTDAPEVSVEDALGTGLDENKLLMEANALSAVTPEDKKLMGDFENFVKKNEG